MALTQCKECGEGVSKSAPTCPKCGVKSPGKRWYNLDIKTGGCGGCLTIIILVWVLGSLVSSDIFNVTEAGPPTLHRWVWSAANIREGRGTNTPVVRTLAAGSEVGVRNAENNWWEVYIADRQIGFISNSVLHRDPPTTARQKPSQPTRRTGGATHVTVENYVACVSRADFDEQFDLAMNDLKAWTRFMASSSCVVTRAGVPIFRRNARGLGVIQIRVEGETTWLFTVSEAARMR